MRRQSVLAEPIPAATIHLPVEEAPVATLGVLHACVRRPRLTLGDSNRRPMLKASGKWVAARRVRECGHAWARRGFAEFHFYKTINVPTGRQRSSPTRFSRVKTPKPVFCFVGGAIGSYL
jgi:hypothetical protein